MSVNNTMDKSDKSDHPHHSYLALSNITKPIVCIFWPEDIGMGNDKWDIYLLARRYISSGQKICIFWPEDIYLLARIWKCCCLKSSNYVGPSDFYFRWSHCFISCENILSKIWLSMRLSLRLRHIPRLCGWNWRSGDTGKQRHQQAPSPPAPTPPCFHSSCYFLLILLEDSSTRSNEINISWR